VRSPFGRVSHTVHQQAFDPQEISLRQQLNSVGCLGPDRHGSRLNLFNEWQEYED
jgi:hypothetical protein